MPLLALGCSICLVLHVGEGDCEVVEGPFKRDARVPDLDGDKFHSSQVLLEGRDEGGVFLGLLCVLVVTAEISAKSNF
jgi:hypothetical protein